MSNWTPTGRTRHEVRRSWRRTFLVLQIQERGIHTYCIGGYIDSDWVTRWRDATTSDLTVIPRVLVPTPPARETHEPR